MVQRVLFIHTGLMPFVKQDIDILSQDYQVTTFFYETSKSILKNVREYFKQLAWLISNIYDAKFIYIWFADYHTFIPILCGKLFSKKSFIVVGGYDSTYIKEIKYGVFSNPIRSFCARFSYKYCTKILAVDESLKNYILANVYIRQNKIKTIYTGYDSSFWDCSTVKENSILTVANIKDFQTFRRKGIDFFIKVARAMPQYKFIIVGKNCELKVWENLPNNLELIGKMSQKDLLYYYSKSKVYAQFSIFEGLPNVICESMLCKCIPIGTNICGIPTAIGENGFIISSISEAVNAIEQALNNLKLPILAREFIRENFTLENRKEELRKVMTFYSNCSS